jgi:hypothetical protein
MSPPDMIRFLSPLPHSNTEIRRAGNEKEDHFFLPAAADTKFFEALILGTWASSLL